MKTLFFIQLLVTGMFTYAQKAAINAGNLTIHPGATVSVFGDLTNTSSGGLLNNGQLYIKGNVTSHEEDMNAGTGSLYFNGSTIQSLNGSQLFKTKNLVTNNPSGITLNNDLSVSGIHTFTSGILTTSASPNYLIYEEGSSYTGVNDSRHVNGWIKKAGSTDFTFPVGNENIERSIAVTNLSAHSVFAVKYNSTTPFTTQKQAPLVSINPNEYWQVNKVSGGDATVTMNWDNSKVRFMNWAPSDIRVAGYNGSSWISLGGTASGNVTTTGTITSNPVSAFNLFSLGSQSSVLPLTLLNFEAKRVNGNTEITWQTDNEQDVAHFTVDRSDNGLQYYTIAQKPARNSGRFESYSTFDKKPISNQAYYRLKSVDIDGTQKFSQVVKVTDNNRTGGLTLLTNPVKEKLILVPGNDISGPFQYSIVTNSGQILQQGKINIQKQEHAELPVKASVKPGTYILSLKNAWQSLQIKFIVQ